MTDVIREINLVGLDTTDVIGNDGALVAQNLTPCDNGTLKTRKGYYQYLATGSDIPSWLLQAYSQTYRCTRTLMTARTTSEIVSKVKYIDDAGAVQTLVTMARDYGVRYCKYREQVFVFDGEVLYIISPSVNYSTLQEYKFRANDKDEEPSGSTYSGVAPIPKIMVECDNRLFAVTMNEPFVVYYSAFNGYTDEATYYKIDFPAANVFAVPGRGDDMLGITAMAKIGGNDNLCIFLNSSFYVLTGTGDASYAVVKSPYDVGCFSQELITTDNNGMLYFADRDNIYTYNGEVVTPIGIPIQKDWKDIDKNFSQMHFWKDEGVLIISHRGGSFVYNPVSKKWTTWDIPISGFAEMDGQIFQKRTMFSKSATAGINYFGASTDSGTAIEWEYRTQHLPLTKWFSRSGKKNVKLLLGTESKNVVNLKVYEDFDRYRTDDLPFVDPKVENWDKLNRQAIWNVSKYADKKSYYSIYRVIETVSTLPDSTMGYLTSLSLFGEKPVTIYAMGVQLEEAANRKEVY